MKKKSKGFTLVELLVTIFIVSIVLGIGTYTVISIINNSKEKSLTISMNNIKSSARLYVEENNDNIVWQKQESTKTETSCISISNLLEQGYLKESDIKDITHEYIIITKDSNNKSIIKEEFDTNTTCNNNIITIPTSKKYCLNVTYNGESQILTKESTEAFSFSSNKGINAGEYTVKATLQDGYTWSDSTNKEKTITCTIKKADINLELSSPGTENGIKIGTHTITLKSNISGTISLKSSNEKYVTATVNDNNIESETEKEISINVLATRNTDTIITITVTPTDENQNNYKETSTEYIIGNATRKEAEIPTSDKFCKNLTYNGAEQTLTETEAEGYIFKNNKATDVGESEVTATLKYGYIWTDGTTNDKIINCSITNNVCTIKLDNQDANIKEGTKEIYTELNSGVYLDSSLQKLMTPIKNPIEVPEKTGYEFAGYYTEQNGKGTQMIGDTANNDDEPTTIGYLTPNFTSTYCNTETPLYAKWEPKTSQIIYHPNNGIDEYTYTQTCYYGQDCTIYKELSAPNGYTFNKWTTVSDGSGNSYKNNQTIKNMTAENIIVNLYANWTPNEYNVTLYQTGATKNSDPEVLTATYGEKLPNLNSLPEKIFTIKYIDENGNALTSIDQNQNEITQSSVALTFEGFYKGTSTNTTDSQTDTPYIDSAGIGTTKWDLSEDTTLYARWSPTTISLPTPKNNKVGYTFCGWYSTNSNGSCTKSTFFGDPNDEITVGANTTLYGLYEANTYIITLNNQNADINEGTTKLYEKYNNGIYKEHVGLSDYIMTSTKNKITIPEKTGYTFLGYYTEKTNGTQLISATGYIVEENFTNTRFTDDTTIYAQWEPIDVTLTLKNTAGYIHKIFDTEGVTLTDSNKDGKPDTHTVTYKYGDKIIISPVSNDNYVLFGNYEFHHNVNTYHFKGYYNENDSNKTILGVNGRYTFNIYENTTLIVDWENLTPPACEIEVNGTTGDNGWYTSDVTLNLKTYSNDSSLSITGYDLTTSNTTSYNKKSSTTLNSNTTGTKYYGYVKSSNGETSSCSVTIKIDKTKPTCTNSGDSTTWTKNNREISYGCSDTTSGCDLSSSNTGTKTFNTTTKTTTISSYSITDKAGNTTTCSSRTANVYVDKTQPTCNFPTNQTTWTKYDRTISWGCKDSHSGCTTTTIGSATINKTTDIYPLKYTITDNVGNTRTCETNVNVLVDKDSPTINLISCSVKQGNVTGFKYSCSNNICNVYGTCNSTYCNKTCIVQASDKGSGIKDFLEHDIDKYGNHYCSTGWTNTYDSCFDALDIYNSWLYEYYSLDYATNDSNKLQLYFND